MAYLPTAPLAYSTHFDWVVLMIVQMAEVVINLVMFKTFGYTSRFTLANVLLKTMVEGSIVRNQELSSRLWSTCHFVLIHMLDFL